MRLFSHARDVGAHCVGGDTNEAADPAHGQLTDFNQTAYRADGHAAQLARNFVKGP